MTRIDQLEQQDERFARSEDGRLKETFKFKGEYTPIEYDRQRRAFVDGMKRDAANWRRSGDEAAASRAEVQLAYQEAAWTSTAASRQRDRSNDQDQRSRSQERMLEADRNTELAQQKIKRLDATYGTDAHRRRQEEQRQANQQTSQGAEIVPPLSERLQSKELEVYERAREHYDQVMSRYLPAEARSAGSRWSERSAEEMRKFDTMFEEHLRARSSEKQSERATAAAGASNDAPKTGQAGNEEAAKADRAQAQDGAAQQQAAGDRKGHAPLLREHQGYKPEVSEDGKGISYRRPDGREAFRDLGARVSVKRDVAGQRHPEDVRAALNHAASKFDKLNIRGPKEFREQCAREIARMDNGLADRVTNEDLKQLIAEERQRMAAEQAQRAIADARQAKADRRERVEDQQGRADERSDVVRRVQQDRPDASDEQLASDASKSRTPKRPDSESSSASAQTPSASTQSVKAKGMLPKPEGYDEYMARQAATKNGETASAGASSKPDGDSAPASHSARPTARR